MYLFIGVAAYILNFSVKGGITTPIKDSNQIFENFKNKDGIIESIPAALFPKINPSKEIDSSKSGHNIGGSQRSEEQLSPIMRFLITTKTSTVFTTVATKTSTASSWRSCYTTDANIVSCTPTSGQVTISGRRKRESSNVVTNPLNKPIATLNGKDIDFNDIISPSRASRQNEVDATLTENSNIQIKDGSSDVKDGRARIVDPPRYEEVGISGLPLPDENCKENGADTKLQEYQQPRFITIHTTKTSSVTATTTQTEIQAATQTIHFKSVAAAGACFPQQVVATTLSLAKCT